MILIGRLSCLAHQFKGLAEQRYSGNAFDGARGDWQRAILQNILINLFHLHLRFLKQLAPICFDIARCLHFVLDAILQPSSNFLLKIQNSALPGHIGRTLSINRVLAVHIIRKTIFYFLYY